MAECATERCAAPTSPGATLRDDGAVFAVASRNAESISVCLFDAEDRETDRIALSQRDDDLRYGFIPRIAAGQRYGLRAEGPWDPQRGHRFDPAKLLVDPYATQLDRPFVYDPTLATPRPHARDTARLVPKAIVQPAVVANEAKRKSKAEPPRLIYEVGVRAHTKCNPDVPLDLRGTLRGLAAPHVVARMQKLGVSHVEIMPVTAWIDERHLPPLGLTNAWGYNPVTFMALDPRLAPGGFDDLQHVTDVLRAAGIGVLVDVVFNHSGESDAQGPTLSLRGLDNALYYRHAQDGSLINDAGCGNILACDEPVVRRLVLDSLRRFAEAGVAGFRFDLATTLGRNADCFSPDAPLLQEIATDPLLRGLELIAEPWDIGPGGYQVGTFRAPWREWNDRYRDDVRRFWRGDAHAAGAFATRIAGSSDLFRRENRTPSASVNFVAAHDGFSLRDLVSYSSKRNLANGEDNRDGNGSEIAWNCDLDGETGDAEIPARRGADVRALLATLFLSRGTPMLTAGDEFGRTQGGNNNAYAQDNVTTWLDWAAADRDLATFVAALAALRARIPLLHADRFLDGRAHDDARHPDAAWTRADGLRFEDADWNNADFIGLTLAPVDGDGARAHLMFNRGETSLDARPPAPAPDRQWRLALDSAAGFCGDLAREIATIHVPARGVVALIESTRGAGS
jgi:glycogen debranching enzyme